MVYIDIECPLELLFQLSQRVIGFQVFTEQMLLEQTSLHQVSFQEVALDQFTEEQILLEQMSLELEFVEQVVEKSVVPLELVSFEQKVLELMQLGRFSLNKCHWNDYTKSKELSSFQQMLLDQALFEKVSLD